MLPEPHPHPSPLRTLAPVLLPHLPYSLPLLRRLQYVHSSPTTHTLATFPPSTSTPPNPNQPFAATWLDRHRAPETECWLFSTYETHAAKQDTLGSHEGNDDEVKHSSRQHLRALLLAIAKIPSPNSSLLIIGTLNVSLIPLLAASAEELAALPEVKILARSIVEARDVLLQPDGEGEGEGAEAGKGKEKGVLSCLGLECRKWLIAPPSNSLAERSRSRSQSQSQSQGLPEGYVFSEVRREEVGMVIARTDVPRTLDTLQDLGNVGVRWRDSAGGKGTEADGGGELIAWAFLGVDGSLTSLHVDPAHRRRGIAKAVAGRLFGLLAVESVRMGFRAVEGGEGVGGRDMGTGEGWAMSDVLVGNVESDGVTKALGGREGWVVRWVSVDLGRVEKAVGRLGW